ncbi:class I SAM-dependent methyltransferase [Actinomadura spongiicola]|uniref:Class I SAM-dependent methyltransferase n=1 Tax=Actinomadura spongiicola TaxID=2303421 RepID=A0A372GDL1_9ACTN|nr:class I SAM-dependent methyltransferase [Actinomadura spongiicola]RFS83440.1 class I SAM-dependent methyltransferase [Actinomadura spongiicola]
MSDAQGAFTRATGRGLGDRDAEAAGPDKPRYRRYQFDLIAPHCGASVLEVGAGLGEFSAQFSGLARLVVTDVDPGAVELARKRFAPDGRVADDIEVRVFDLDAGDLLDRPVHSAVAINVLEHFEDDAAVLASLARSVVPGGTVVLWVPGYQSLYSDFDRKVGHFRRYTPATLRDAIVRAGLGCELARPVNLLGGLAWWTAMRLGRAQKPNSGAVGMYDRVIVPVTRVLDRVLPVPFGQSVLAVARVPADAGTAPD